MRRRFNARVLLSSVLGLVAASPGLYAAPGDRQPQPNVRVIQASYNQSIADRLLPDDEIVQVDRDVDVFDIEPEPTREWWINYAIETAETIVTVDVREVTGILVDEGMWIHTRLTGVARDVLKAAGDSAITRQRPIGAQVSGGEVRIGKVLVRTGDLIRRPAGRRYLMFLRFSREWGSLVPTSPMLLVENGRLVGLLPGGASANKLHGVRLSEIQERVRAAR